MRRVATPVSPFRAPSIRYDREDIWRRMQSGPVQLRHPGASSQAPSLHRSPSPWRSRGKPVTSPTSRSHVCAIPLRTLAFLCPVPAGRTSLESAECCRCHICRRAEQPPVGSTDYTLADRARLQGTLPRFAAVIPIDPTRHARVSRADGTLIPPPPLTTLPPTDPSICFVLLSRKARHEARTSQWIR